MKPEYELKLSADDLAVLSKALLELTYREAAPVINKINHQLNTQVAVSKSED